MQTQQGAKVQSTKDAESQILFGSVCSGIEAASVAWNPLGWKAAWLSEIDPFACAVLAHHHPDVPNLGDMTKLPERILSGEIKAPDVLCGGTPCQAFSVAGLRKSLGDARGNLSLTFCEIANAIDSVRAVHHRPPATVFWENVPGVLSTKDNAFGCFLAGLAGDDETIVPEDRPAAGKSSRYWKWSKAAGDHSLSWPKSGCVIGPKRTVAWRILDAQYFGVAQRRRRVFVVASARKGFDPAAVLFEFDGVRRDSAPSREPWEDAAAGTLRSTDGGCDVDHGQARHLQPIAFGGNNQSGPIDVDTARNACASASGRMDFETETFLVQPTHTLRGEGFDASEDGTGRGTPLVPVAGLPIGFQTRGSNLDVGDIAGTIGTNADRASGSAPMVCFDTTQVTSATNRSNPKPGDPCHPLAAGAHPPAIEFDCKASGMAGFGVGDIASTMRAMGHAESHANGGVQLAVAHVQIMPTMTAGGPSDTSHNQIRGQMRDAYMVPTTAMQVRRLTPRECERLQGFPDDYTAIPWRKKPASECPDSPRYKALGNSWAVPVVRWIGCRMDTKIRQLDRLDLLEAA